MSLNDLARANNKVVGSKQTTKAIQSGVAQVVYIAEDADAHVVNPLMELCKEKGIDTVQVESMKELGKASGIDVGSASAAIIN